MNDFLAIAAQNTLIAGILALLVYGLTRIWRRPPVAHVLWLLVLAKLIGPPVLHVDWLGFFSHASTIESHNADRKSTPSADVAILSPADHAAVAVIGRQANPATSDKTAREANDSPAEEATTFSAPEIFFATYGDFFWMYWDEALTGIFFAWMAGLVPCGLIALGRIVRFDRTIRGTLAAPQRLQVIAAELAEKLGLRRVPDLRLINGAGVPLAWCVGRRPIIVLPRQLVDELDDQEASMVLAHEMAHLRRRDHWIRGVEILISVVYWWNPLVWWVRRELHQVEELCCDAWVDWVFPDRKKCYAEVLFKAAMLAGTIRRPAPSLASSFLNRAMLKGRIEAILDGRLSRQVSRRGALLLAGIAIVLLPSFVQSVQTADADVPAASSTESKPADSKSGPAKSGKIIGTVTVEGTNEPVNGAVISVMLGKMKEGNAESVTAKTNAKGRYSLEVPLGNVSFLYPELLPGYWFAGRAENIAISSTSPIVTKDFDVRRGPVWQIRAWDPTASKPIPGIQCSVIQKGKDGPSFSNTASDAEGIARATLPGHNGAFQLVLFDAKQRGKWELVPASLTIEPGFHVDRVSEVTENKQAGTFQIKDKQGKLATLRHARASLVGGKVLIDVDLMPTAIAAVGAVRGIVVDQRGQPIAGARVETAQENDNGSGFMTGAAATTGTDGRFEIRNPGIRTAGNASVKLSLVVTKDGFGGIDAPPRRLLQDIQRPIDFGRIELSAGKSVRIRVVDTAGGPVIGAWVRPLGGYASFAEQKTTDERGECTIRNLPAGMIKLDATFGNYFASAVAFPGDAPVPVTLKLKPFPKFQPATKRSEHHPIALGTPAPAFAVAEWIDGKTRSLADYKGKVVVLDFWGIWCGICVRSIPMMKDLKTKYKDRDVVFLSIHTAGTEIEQIREFQRQLKVDFVTALDAGDDVVDGATSKKYGVRGYPTAFIIGRDGRIAWCNDQFPQKNVTQKMKRAAKALSIPWPADQKQPQEKLAAQMTRIREYLFSEVIDKTLAER